MAEIPGRKDAADDENENFKTYLHDLLSDLGIQLSPGGMGIVEIDHLPSDEEVSCSLLAPVESPPTVPEGGEEVRARKRKRFTGTIKAHVSSPDLSSDEDAVTSPVPSQEAAEQPSPSFRNPEKKPKIYQIEKPFNDPELERKRINAITAKQNRDKKKMEIDRLRADVRNLSRVNSQCSKALKRTNADIQKLYEKLESSRKHNSLLQEKIKQKEMEIRGQQEKFVLFRGHLDLILSSLEDDGPAKKLIANLLKKLPEEAEMT
ncbi:uncharacterized protein LOC122253034 isoform X2 [Penaeus japonicus]|uniref:uncharacterized protein LOC122253034 isoform X2 n=1 Tax=Penaeus japonicus TaxID=27405 RepID=UPI001C71123F|nr:uncharacterized protein LOC122253034 isoform X2 [Penaeus japonicus]